MKCPNRILALALAAALPALADGDPAAGRKLVEAKACEGCHAAQNLDGARAIYLRKERKVRSMDELGRQIHRHHGLRLGLSPAEEADVAAFLNDAYYHFK